MSQIFEIKLKASIYVAWFNSFSINYVSKAKRETKKFNSIMKGCRNETARKGLRSMVKYDFKNHHLDCR